MPKVFRPNLSLPTVRTTRTLALPTDVSPTEAKNDEEVPLSASPPPIAVNQSSLPDNVQVSSELEVPCAAISKEVSSEQCPISSESISPAVDSSVDIDNCVSFQESTEEHRTNHAVSLFTKKRVTHRNTQNKCVDPIPEYDEPLDRATVSLRSLLHWVPKNKPPPSYRQMEANGELKNNIAESKADDINIAPSVDAKAEQPRQESQSDVQAAAAGTFEPQLCLDADGNIVLDEASLFVSIPETTDREHMRHVNEDTGVLGVTYNSFRHRANRCSRLRWSPGETLRFYRALSTIGQDFYSMIKLFPNRTRADLKRKYKREMRVNPYLVNEALKNRRVYDLTALMVLSEDEDDSNKAVTTKKDAILDGLPPKSRRGNKVKKLEELPKNKQKSTRQQKVRLFPNRTVNPLPANTQHPHIDTVMETIDAVLNEYRECSSSQIEFTSTNRDCPMATGPTGVSMAMNESSLLTHMIQHTRNQIQEHTSPQLLPDFTPLPSALYASEPPLSVDLISDGRFSPIEIITLPMSDESPKIDLLRFGRSLLGD